MLCGAFHFNCTTFSLNLYGVEAMKIKYKCELCNTPFQFAKTLEKHIETEHIETNKIDYFRKYLLDENKKLCAERNGYKIYYIWNNDYLNDKDGVVEKCVNIIKENCNL